MSAGFQSPLREQARQAVFLHTGWRSGGTWLWSRCREQPGVHALYEPLHEQLAWLRPADITRLRPGSWASNHSDTPPYFQEYEGLLRPGRRGVPHYQQRFAFERFFLDPDDDDPELEAYLASLLGTAAPGQVCVLKFCRSLGRTAWLQRRFPGALHAVVMRDPVTQWASAQRLLTMQRNRYFATAPLLVLARNAAHPLVRAATKALDVRLPALHSPDIAYGIEACWRHLRRATEEQRYRGFLAFWTVCGIEALSSGAQVIDARKTVMDPVHRRHVEAALGVELGQVIGSRTPAEPYRAGWLGAAHQAASLLASEHGDTLASDRLGLLLGYLGVDASMAMPTLSQPPSRNSRPTPNLVPARSRPARAPDAASRSRNRLQRLVTSAAVVIARTLQPIRRLNGALTRPRNQIT